METTDAPSTSPTLLGQLGDLNNHQAWNTFVERYKPLIDRWCRRGGLQPADVDEVGARILAKLTEAMTTFRYDPAHRFRGWLKTVAENAVRDFWRDLGRRPGALGSGDTDAQKALEQVEAPPDVEGLAQELEETLGRDLERASEVTARVRARVLPHTWQAYWLTVVEGRPAQEVAEQLGLSTLAVYKAKQRVGEMLRAEGTHLKNQGPVGREAPP
jgi:RNA polymerase sigma-70 factor (ECF subfamily)